MLFAFPTLTHDHPDSQSAGLTRRPSHHPETNRYRNPKKMNGMLSEFHYIQSRWQTRYTIKDAISNNVTKDDTWYTRSSRRDCINPLSYDMQLGETMSPHTSIASSNGKAILTEITQYTNAAGFL